MSHPQAKAEAHDYLTPPRDCAFESRPALQEFPDQFGAARQASAVPASGLPSSSITLSGLCEPRW